VQTRIISAVKRILFVSDRKSDIILRDRWCQIIVLNIHGTVEDKTNNNEGHLQRGTRTCVR
jgi:hypothetical protein